MSETSDPSSGTASERDVGTAPHVSQIGAGPKDIVDNGEEGPEDLLPSLRIAENGKYCMEVSVKSSVLVAEETPLLVVGLPLEIKCNILPHFKDHVWL